MTQYLNNIFDHTVAKHSLEQRDSHKIPNVTDNQYLLEDSYDNVMDWIGYFSVEFLIDPASLATDISIKLVCQ